MKENEFIIIKATIHKIDSDNRVVHLIVNDVVVPFLKEDLESLVEDTNDAIERIVKGIVTAENLRRVTMLR